MFNLFISFLLLLFLCSCQRRGIDIDLLPIAENSIEKKIGPPPGGVLAAYAEISVGDPLDDGGQVAYKTDVENLISMLQQHDVMLFKLSPNTVLDKKEHENAVIQALSYVPKICVNNFDFAPIEEKIAFYGLDDNKAKVDYYANTIKKLASYSSPCMLMIDKRNAPSYLDFNKLVNLFLQYRFKLLVLLNNEDSMTGSHYSVYGLNAEHIAILLRAKIDMINDDVIKAKLKPIVLDLAKIIRISKMPSYYSLIDETIDYALNSLKENPALAIDDVIAKITTVILKGDADHMKSLALSSISLNKVDDDIEKSIHAFKALSPQDLLNNLNGLNNTITNNIIPSIANVAATLLAQGVSVNNIVTALLPALTAQINAQGLSINDVQTVLIPALTAQLNALNAPGGGISNLNTLITNLTTAVNLLNKPDAKKEYTTAKTSIDGEIVSIRTELTTNIDPILTSYNIASQTVINTVFTDKEKLLTDMLSRIITNHVSNKAAYDPTNIDRTSGGLFDSSYIEYNYNTGGFGDRHAVTAIKNSWTELEQAYKNADAAIAITPITKGGILVNALSNRAVYKRLRGSYLTKFNTEKATLMGAVNNCLKTSNQQTSPLINQHCVTDINTAINNFQANMQPESVNLINLVESYDYAPAHAGCLTATTIPAGHVLRQFNKRYYRENLSLIDGYIANTQSYEQNIDTLVGNNIFPAINYKTNDFLTKLINDEITKNIGLAQDNVLHFIYPYQHIKTLVDAIHSELNILTVDQMKRFLLSTSFITSSEQKRNNIFQLITKTLLNELVAFKSIVNRVTSFLLAAEKANMVPWKTKMNTSFFDSAQAGSLSALLNDPDTTADLKPADIDDKAVIDAINNLQARINALGILL